MKFYDRDFQKKLRKLYPENNQYLTQEAIYSVNRVLSEIQDELGLIDGISLNPIIHNKYLHTQHFFYINTPAWGKSDIVDNAETRELTISLVSALFDIIQKGKKTFLNSNFFENNNVTDIENISDEELFIECLLVAKVRMKKEIQQKDINYLDDFFEILIDIVKIDSKKRIENEIFNEKINCGEHFFSHFIKVIHYLYSNINIPRELFLHGFLFESLKNKKNDILLIEVFNKSKHESSANIYHYDKSIDNNVEFDQYKNFEKYKDNNYFNFVYAIVHELFPVLTGFYQEKKSVSYIFPLYDVWLGGCGFGNVNGLISLTPKQYDEEFCFEDKLKSNNILTYDMVSRFEALSEELYRTALAKVIDEPITPPYDLIEHFVKSLIYVQDWQQIKVFKSNGDVDYCYIRQNQSYLSHWVRCPSRTCYDCEQKERLRSLKWSAKETKDEIQQDLLDNFWNKSLMPEVTDDELHKFSKINLELYYPKTTYIPEKISDDDYTPYHFEMAVKKQQLDVMRLLLIKVRERRNAIKMSATSIMARNISHNLGSHVLASITEHDLLSKSKECNKQENDKDFDILVLIRYLQERMDFLAESATVSGYYSSPIRLREMCDYFSKQCIVKERISAVNKIKSKIYIHKKHDYRIVSVCGGHLGQQAFFIIIENIIRNSAKHECSEDNIDDIITIELDVKTSEKWPDYLEIKIRAKKKNDTNNDDDNALDKLNELIDKINKIIKSPIIDSNNSLIRKNLGIREMVLSAAYLRHIELEDIESRIEPPVLESFVHSSKVGNNKSTLAYKFYLLKPKEFLVVDESLYQLTDDSKRKELSDIGIDVTYSLHDPDINLNYYRALICREIVVAKFNNKSKLPIIQLDLIDNVDTNQKEILYFLMKAIEQLNYNKLTEKYGCKDKGVKLFHSDDFSVDYAIGETLNKEQCLDKNKCNLFFQRHKENHYSNDVYSKLIFHEISHSSSPQYKYINNPGEKLKEIYELRFTCAALSKIIVLDERIQKDINNNEQVERLAKSRIYVPSINEMDLYHPEYSKINAYIYEKNQFDFLIIHKGILDKLDKEINCSSTDTLNKLLVKRNSILVICSGRGVPSDIDGNRFLSLSVITKFILDTPSKFHLYESLIFSRSP